MLHAHSCPPPHSTHARLQNCLHHCYLHCPLKARLLQFPLSQPSIHPTKAAAAHPKLTSQSRHQNAQASSYHSHPQITPLVKNPRANSLQSPITNLQLPTILQAQLSSRPLPHPANPIILCSHSFSTS